MQDHGDSEMLPSLVSEYMERGTLRDELIRNPNLDIFNMARNYISTLLKARSPDSCRSMVLQMVCHIYMPETSSTGTLSR